MKFRKRPVVIEAMQIDGTEKRAEEIAAWSGGVVRVMRFTHNGEHNGWVEIKTLEGTMTACAPAFIIKGVNGEFYPCKLDIFDKTYEALRDMKANVPTCPVCGEKCVKFKIEMDDHWMAAWVCDCEVSDEEAAFFDAYKKDNTLTGPESDTTQVVVYRGDK